MVGPGVRKDVCVALTFRCGWVSWGGGGGGTVETYKREWRGVEKDDASVAVYRKQRVELR